MLPLEDLSTIFYKIEDIKQYHQTFVDQLEEKVDTWSDDQEIGHIFKELVRGTVFVEAKLINMYPTNEMEQIFQCFGLNL